MGKIVISENVSLDGVILFARAVRTVSCSATR